MEKKINVATTRVHCVVLPFPGQGHINPMLQFSKLLQHEGVRVTLITTHSYCKSTPTPAASSIALEPIFNDGFFNSGIEGLKSTLTEFLEKLEHVDCIIYDSLFPWALDVAKKLGIVGVAFLTQNMSVNTIYYHVHLGKLRVPLVEHENISLPLLPKLQLGDMPSFFNFEKEENPPVLDMLVRQLSNINEADWILCNSFYELEKELIDWTMKIWSKFRTIGPSIPSKFSDKRLKDDEDYGLTQFKSSEECIMKWLDNKPKGSVVYVSFGSLVTLKEEQIEEVACGLRDSGCNFLWVVRASEESKLPKDFEKNRSEKGLVVTWCSQLKVLAHEAIGCFVTHCGWNSILEALSLGVPMIAMPQWSDQTTNAKFIADVWKMGIRAPIDEKEIVRRDVLKNCILEIMGSSEKEKEIKNNVMQWNDLIMRAVNEGGSSHENIIEFVNSLLHLQGTSITETN